VLIPLLFTGYLQHVWPVFLGIVFNMYFWGKKESISRTYYDINRSENIGQADEFER
jgi:hypothetical protein